MLFISTSKIRESKVGSSFTVTYSANPESVEELKALHSTYSSVNMSEFTIKPQTEPQNYCDDCLYTDTCDSKEFFYACTSKATISKMEQVDKDTNVRSKEPQIDWHYSKQDGLWYPYKYEDEPQTEDELLREQCRAFIGIVEQTNCAWKKGE